MTEHNGNRTVLLILLSVVIGYMMGVSHMAVTEILGLFR